MNQARYQVANAAPLAAGAAHASAIATLDRVSKRYGERLALDAISLSLYAGEVVAVLGQNGAGKSTSIRILLGLSQPNSGTVRVFGADPRQRAVRMRIGTMLQVGVAGVPAHLCVQEHIEQFRAYYPAPLSQAEVIAAAGLQGLEQRRFGALSGGEQQRVLFALAICGNPDLLFLDEPTVGMDVESRRLMGEQIRRFATCGKTVLLTTHYLEEADELADRILVVHHGKVIAEGSPAQIKSRHGARIIRCRTTLSPALLLGIASVQSVHTEGAVTVIAATDPDAVVRQLVARDSALAGLEVAALALEDAFVELTAAAPGAAAQPD